MDRKTVILLTAASIIAFFLHAYLFNSVPPCLNGDEAAYGYNAYSILQTSKDEYGTTLPLRLKSFGDYKLPLYSYLSMPFVKAFGLNEFSVRAAAGIIGIVFPFVMYLLVWELFRNKRVALLSAFLIAVSPWFQTISRQAHESLLATLFLSLAIIFFLRLKKNPQLKNGVLFSLFTFLSLFSYHISRVFAVFLIAYIVVFLLKKSKESARISQKNKLILLALCAIPLCIFVYTDLRFRPARVENLLFFKNQGFALKIDELRRDHDVRLLHNKVTQGFIDETHEYLKYFSPHFLVISGDANLRFGHPGISPISAVEYGLLFIGVYFLIRKKEKERVLIILLLLLSPLSASLSWQEYGLNRSFFMIIPLLTIISYGVVSLWNFEKLKKVVIVLALVYAFFTIYSWDYYFHHYPKRATVIRSWQCGNKEMANYIRENYDRFNTFHITRKNGQPYIFLLFYMRYDPASYQRQALLSRPDEFGFGQVEEFDKFKFNFKFDPEEKNAVSIGYPDDFNNTGITESQVKKIAVAGEEIFWIYEN